MSKYLTITVLLMYLASQTDKGGDRRGMGAIQSGRFQHRERERQVHLPDAAPSILQGKSSRMISYRFVHVVAENRCHINTRRGRYLGKMFWKQLSESSSCFPGQQESCRTTVELSENNLQNIVPRNRPY